jgi:hypothetical protein
MSDENPDRSSASKRGEPVPDPVAHALNVVRARRSDEIPAEAEQTTREWVEEMVGGPEAYSIIAHIESLERTLAERDSEIARWKKADELHVAQLGQANGRCWELEGQLAEAHARWVEQQDATARRLIEEQHNLVWKEAWQVLAAYLHDRVGWRR